MILVKTPLELSLRDAHKSRTRRALREAALKLFAAQGFDATTIEEIAAKVGVAGRTFFRYFPTKESVLLLGQQLWVQHFSEIYLKLPDYPSEIDAVCAALIELVTGHSQDRPSLRLFDRAVASSPALRGLVQEHQEQTARHMAEAIAVRRGLSQPDEASMLLGSLGMLTYLRALQIWVGGDAEFSEILAQEFQLLKQPFTQKTSSAPIRRRRNTQSRSRLGP
jgi:AcrR family transcriptional regulator